MCERERERERARAIVTEERRREEGREGGRETSNGRECAATFGMAIELGHDDRADGHSLFEGACLL